MLFAILIVVGYLAGSIPAGYWLVRVTKGKFVTVAPPATPWMCWASGEWSDPEFKAFK